MRNEGIVPKYLYLGYKDMIDFRNEFDETEVDYRYNEITYANLIVVEVMAENHFNMTPGI